MPLRPTMIDDLPFLDKLDKELFADRETYPYTRPMFGYYATRTLIGGMVAVTEKKPSILSRLWSGFLSLLRIRPHRAAMNLRFFSLFREGHFAGFMVLRDWPSRSGLSRGNYDARDSEILYLGVAPRFRQTGLGSEALRFALQHHAQQCRHGRTLTRFKPGCARFQHMLDRAGFEVKPWPQDKRMIGVRYSYDTLIRIPRAE